MMKTRFAQGAVVLAVLTFAGCSDDDVESDLESAATEVGDAVGEAAEDAGEAVARNIATQQGEEQFNNAGHELDGPLTCEATVDDGVDEIDISCTGTTQAGGAAELTGTTSEIPGASVVFLDGEFIGTVDGEEVFSTERLGG
jgi:outer membrane murein-binding lipoprotein Lpp